MTGSRGARRERSGMVLPGHIPALRAAVHLGHPLPSPDLVDKPVRLLVFGSRDWPFPGMVNDRLDNFYIDGPAIGPDLFKLITGGARGVDTMAEEWARDMYVWSVVYPADWHKYGKGAGPIRNQHMLDMENPTHYLGFILNNSRGSMDMLSRLQGAKVPGEVVYAYS